MVMKRSWITVDNFSQLWKKILDFSESTFCLNIKVKSVRLTPSQLLFE